MLVIVSTLLNNTTPLIFFRCMGWGVWAEMLTVLMQGVGGGVQNYGKNADIILESSLTGCVNSLITSCTARLTLPTVLIDKRGDVSCAWWCPDCHMTCTGGLAMSFLFLKSSHNMSNARQMYPYELVHGLADNFQTWNFPHNVSNVICIGYFDYRDWQRCYLLTIIFISW